MNPGDSNDAMNPKIQNPSIITDASATALLIAGNIVVSLPEGLTTKFTGHAAQCEKQSNNQKG